MISALPSASCLTRRIEVKQQRASEEAQGTIHWLRPEYQDPTSHLSDGNAQPTATQTELPGTEAPPQPATLILPPATKQPWPKTLPKQAAAVRDLIRKTGWTSDQPIQALAQHFKGVRATKVQAIADALVALGQAA